MQAAVGAADLPDEAALLDPVSAAMKAILNSTIKRPQIPAVCHVDGAERPPGPASHRLQEGPFRDSSTP